jgi:hypothetical protein
MRFRDDSSARFNVERATRNPEWRVRVACYLGF